MAKRLAQGSQAYEEAKRVVLDFKQADLEPDSNKAWSNNYSLWIKSLKATSGTDFAQVYRRIGKELGLSSMGSFYGAIENTKDPEKIRKIVASIIEVGLTYDNPRKEDIKFHHDYLYFGMIDFLGIKKNTEDNTSGYVTGTYQLWRHSRDFPGRYVKGLVEIGRDDSSGSRAIHVRMLQKHTHIDASDTKHLRSSGDQRNRGYLFRRSGGKHYVIIMTDASDTNLVTRGGVRFSIYDNVTHIYNGKKLVVFSMRGFVLGIDESSLIISPVYMERISDDFPGIDKYMESIESGMISEQAAPNIYSRADTPLKVVAILDEHKPIIL